MYENCKTDIFLYAENFQQILWGFISYKNELTSKNEMHIYDLNDKLRNEIHMPLNDVSFSYLFVV